MRIGELYEETVRELAEIDAYRQRMIGRADVLRELVAAGLGEHELRSEGDTHKDDAKIGG